MVDALPEFDWTVLTLPPRFFNWRVRGNSLSWCFGQRDTLARHYDALIATSMCDLSAIRGFIPSLATIPNLLYCHENQFAYPASDSQQGHLENQITTLYSALSADMVVFNSHYNRDSFLSGVDSLLKKLPDHVPREVAMAQLSHSRVLPVGVTPPDTVHTANLRQSGDRLHLIWNHRWEYDKDPELLLQIVKCCDALGLNIDVSIAGQSFRRQPAQFDAIRSALTASGTLRLRHWGYIADRLAYERLLSSADVVLSTAKHDFQGLAVIEAVMAGCVPLLPDDVVYPEYFDRNFLYAGASTESQAQNAAVMLGEYCHHKINGELHAPAVEHFNWETLGEQYRTLVGELLKPR